MVDGTCVERGGYDYMGTALWWGFFAILGLFWRTTVYADLWQFLHGGREGISMG